MNLILILGDQLSLDMAALRGGDKARDTVVMAEVMAETSYVRHHPKKIAFVLSSMRHFADELREQGWKVMYSSLDDAENTGSIPGELLRCAAQTGAHQVIATRPGEWRLIEALEQTPLTMTLLEDDRFVASHAEFEAWTNGRKTLRMEYFYRDMRRKTGLLMHDGKPVGGKWNYDHDNRKPAPNSISHFGPLPFEPDATTLQVLDLVARRFEAHFGTLDGFNYATTRAGALRALEHFITHALPQFGDFQDAMLSDNRFLYHAVLSPYLNIGLLSPMEICKAAEAAYESGHAPINSVEGFIRQIIGWREYVRGIYFHEGPDYTARNELGHTEELPALYWGSDTKMRCMEKAIAQTREDAYAHHIQRLMVTGNFALLSGVDPKHVHAWYLEVYIDAFEWVEAPNTIGMSQFADGGVIASKPYVSSGAYINRMSDYCKGCAYKVAVKSGPKACPFNLLYWHFLIRHRDRFSGNPRMANMYRSWDRMDLDHRTRVLADGDAVLQRLHSGKPV